MSPFLGYEPAAVHKTFYHAIVPQFPPNWNYFEKELSPLSEGESSFLLSVIPFKGTQHVYLFQLGVDHET